MIHNDLNQMIVTSSTTIVEAADTIQQSGARGAFICDDNNELIGIVMDSDIRRALLKDVSSSNSVKTIMNTSPYTIPDDLDEGAMLERAMGSHKLLIPLVDKERRVTGYILPLELVQPSTLGDQGVLPPARVLVIGGAGYIGSVLSEKLLRMGYKVRCLDLLLYDRDSVEPLRKWEDFEFVRGDLRDEDTLFSSLEGVDAVIHLGEIVGDPACKIDPDFTIDTNFMATTKLVQACIRLGVTRFVFTSSCSVYGQNDELVTEESKLNPVSLYARCKIECERAIRALKSQGFCPTILRLATVHGKSHRQRFDLVVNLLTIKALAEGAFQIFGGEQWRPFISVPDICNGIVSVLQASPNQVKDQIFNLGDSRENYTITRVGEIIKEQLPEVNVELMDNEDDPRTYRVSFDKIKNVLKFSCVHFVPDSIRDIIEAYRGRGDFQDYKDPKYHNLKSLTE